MVVIHLKSPSSVCRSSLHTYKHDKSSFKIMTSRFIWYSELFYSHDIGVYLYSERIVYIMFTQIHSVVIVL